MLQAANIVIITGNHSLSVNCRHIRVINVYRISCTRLKITRLHIPIYYANQFKAGRLLENGGFQLINSTLKIRFSAGLLRPPNAYSSRALFILQELEQV